MSSISGPAGQAKETSTPIQPVEKKVALSVAATELKSTRIRTAEAESKRVELSQQTFDTLVNTMTFNIGVFNELLSASRPEALKIFIDAFKTQNPKIDLKNKQQVAAQADEFLKNGGGKAVLAAFKLMEWEASLLHGMSGARFIEGKAPRTGTSADKPKVYYLSKDGLTTENTRPGLSERLSKLFIGKRGNDVIGRYDMRMGNAIDTTLIGTRAGPEGIAYLDKCGWTDRLPLGATENSDILITRLFSIAAARTEMFLETGLKPEEVSQRLNFLDGHGYVGVIAPHLRGESRSGYFPSRFETEMRSITADIKKDTLNKSRELKKKTKEDRVKAKEGSAGAQLKAKVDELKEQGRDLTDAEKHAQQTLIEQEIRKLEGEADLFIRRKLLSGEIGEAEKARNERIDLVNKRQTSIAPMTGETIDLLAWSDPSSQEYWGALEGRVKVLEARRTAIKAEIADLQAEITSERSHRPPAEAIRRIITKSKDDNGQDVETIEDPDPGVKAEFDESRSRVAGLRNQIDVNRAMVNTDIVDNGMNLNQLITHLESIATRRKQIVEGDTVTKEILENYRKAERSLGQKINEETNVREKTDALTLAGQTEKTIRDTIKEKQVKKESMSGVSLNDQREIKALEAVADLYGNPDAKSAMEARLADQQSGIVDDLEVSPELAGYPPVVLQAIKLMLGPEALSSVGNTEQYQRAKALLESKWYMKIIIEKIEEQTSINGKNDIVFSKPDTTTIPITPGYPERAPGGKNEEITEADLKTLTIDMTTTPGTLKPIAKLEPNDIKQETVRRILDAIRKSALGYS